MCGIVGYIGRQNAVPLLVEGLRRLEYRGYDSAGVSVLQDGKVQVRKKAGRIDSLAACLKESPIQGSPGISHTRWATHGPPTDGNSHPHLDASGKIALVHNGVIENYQALKDSLIQKGHSFKSATDTEVLAHLIGARYQEAPQKNAGALWGAVREALKQVTGTYGIVLLAEDFPDLLICARRGSPLIIGVGRGEHFVSSDVNAIAAHTRDVVFLDDFDMAEIRADTFRVERMDEGKSNVQVQRIDFDPVAVEKGGYPHFMLKEIFEQPQTMLNAMRGRFNREERTAVLGGLNLTEGELRAVDRIILMGCGTSWHAALVGEYLLEEIARIPCEVEYSSELRYRHAPTHPNTLALAITQSGETADTLAALREMKLHGRRVLGICNVVGSAIARESNGGIYLHAGPEVGVASTKAFTSQVTVLGLLSLLLGRLRQVSEVQGKQWIEELESLPEKISRILKQDDQIQAVAKKYAGMKSFLFLGRLNQFPVALEGALKLKEITYLHAEGYPAAEMKHGPIALVDENTPSLFLIPKDAMYEKTMGNLEEVKARHGPVIAIATEGDTEIGRKADDVIFVPKTLDALNPLLTNVPLQLFAYHMAVLLGRDVDKPRNLAKSVTVE